MIKIRNKFISAFLVGILSVASIASIALKDIDEVHATTYPARTKELQAAINKVEHLTKSLKTNYLGVKNQSTWEGYIKEARQLISKIPESEKLQREDLEVKVNKNEALVNALGRINHVEKSMAPKEQGGYGNYVGIKNAETWTGYLNLAEEYLEKVDKSIFQDQYNELVSRKDKVTKVLDKIENDFKIEYDKVLKLVEEAKESNDIDKLKEALKEAEKLGTCERSDILEKEIKEAINGNSSEENNKVVFKDKVLEEVVREAIKKTTGDLYKKDVENITEIYCQGYLGSEGLEDDSVHDISGIENLVNLETLDLSSNYIKDITPLKNLKKLNKLDISGNKIKDISSLENLTNLKTLQIYDCNVSDITPLKKLVNLTNLSLDKNEIKDISVLSNLTQLQGLGLSNNQIKDISPISNLIKLTGLSFSDNKVEDIKPLSNLTKLKELDFARNQVKDITPLSSLVKLYMLNFDSNQVEDINSLESLSELVIIYLWGNNITDFSVFDRMPNLEMINK